MAYGFLKRLAKENESIKDYLDEGMVFEAFIVVIRESDLPAQKVFDEIEKEGYLKYSRLTGEEYTSLMYEWLEYTRNGEWKEER